MPAAATRARDHRYVDAVVGGPQRDLAQQGVPELIADATRDRGPGDGAQMVDDALREGLVGARALVVVSGELGHGEHSVVQAFDVRQPAREQLELALWDALV